MIEDATTAANLYSGGDYVVRIVFSKWRYVRSLASGSREEMTNVVVCVFRSRVSDLFIVIEGGVGIMSNDTRDELGRFRVGQERLQTRGNVVLARLFYGYGLFSENQVGNAFFLFLFARASYNRGEARASSYDSGVVCFVGLRDYMGFV